MARSALLLAAASLTPCAALMTSSLIFNQSEAVSVYTSVGTTVLGGTRPNFAVADGLNAPKFAEVYDGNGNLVWTFTNGTGDFLVDTARHAEGQDNGPVDVFVASCDTSGCTLFGRTSATDTTRWVVTLPECSVNVEGGTYVNLESSDSGNRVAFLCRFADPAGAPTARVYLIGGQSGHITWTYDLGQSIKAGQGQVQITASGSFVVFVNELGVPTPNSAEAYILDGATGVLRDTIAIPFFITAAISDSGDYVAVGDEPLVHVHAWNNATSKYQQAYDLVPPGSNWIPWECVVVQRSLPDAFPAYLLPSLPSPPSQQYSNVYGRGRRRGRHCRLHQF